MDGRKSVSQRKEAQRGNVLFIILIAIVLFAALSFVVSGMMRGGGSGVEISEQKAQLYADETIDYARKLRQAAQTLRISSGCSDTQLSFEAPGLTGYAHTPAAADSCKVFHSEGAGLVYQSPPADVNGGQDWIFTGANDGKNVGTQCNAASCADLVAILPGITLGICQAMNKKFGLALTNDYLTQEDDSFSVTKFQGTYSYAARIEDSAGLNALDGRHQGCLEGKNAPQSAGTYYFYQVLIAR